MAAENGHSIQEQVSLFSDKPELLHCTTQSDEAQPKRPFIPAHVMPVEAGVSLDTVKERDTGHARPPDLR